MKPSLGISRIKAVCRLFRTVLLLTVAAVSTLGQQFSDFTTPTPLREGDTLVIGFLGGWERWDDSNRGVRRLALTLRSLSLEGLHLETVSNRRRNLAVELVRKALDSDSNGSLDERERAACRIIAYGQSFGGAAAVKFARDLQALGVPVELTVQVDSVGVGDEVIPPNVVEAANFYQSHRFTVRGQRQIRAADPRRTRIVENTRFDYSHRDPRHKPDSWFRQRFGGAHAWMDADPEVWDRVQTLILRRLPPKTAVQ